MKKIFKYQLEIAHEQVIQMPENSKILTVQCQNNLPVLWAEANLDNDIKPYIFITMGTGHDIPKDEEDSLKYIGTYQLNNGEFIGHLYLLTPNTN